MSCQRRHYHFALLLYILIKAILSQSTHGGSIGVLASSDFYYGRSGAATFVRNNALYTYGGSTTTKNYTNTFSFLALSTNELIYKEEPQPIQGPACSFSQAVILDDNNTVVLFAGMYPNINWSDKLPVYIYKFNDLKPTWNRIIPTTKESWPTSRKEFSAVLSPGGDIYLYGGLKNDANMTVLNDLWTFNPTTNKFTDISLPKQAYMYGHTSVASPTGSIYFISGKISYTSMTAKYQFSVFNSTLVYRPHINQWSLGYFDNGQFPGRVHASSVLAPDKNNIYIFGGDDGNIDWNMITYNDIFIFTISNWNCTKIETYGPSTSRRSYPSIGFIDDSTFVTAYGYATGKYFDTASVLKINSSEKNEYSWVDTSRMTSIDPTPESKGLTKGAIAGLTISVAIIFILSMIYAWVKRDRVNIIFSSIYRTAIWTPRSGEPLWTEVLRLLSRIILVITFISFFGFSLFQVLNSTTTTIEIASATAYINVPDARICFDGWDNSSSVSYEEKPHVGCVTDTGYNCVEFIIPLDMEIHRPAFSSQVGYLTCFLFSPPEGFGLSNSLDGLTNGTTIDIKGKGNDQLLTPKQVSNWMQDDQRGKQTIDMYNLAPSISSSLVYQIKDHQYLQDVSWNNIGLFPALNHTPEITTVLIPGVGDLSRRDSDLPYLGCLTIIPSDYKHKVLQEKKTSTFMSVLGPMGGVLSILATIHRWVFGTRPDSPWGIIHRWSFGPLKHSIKRNLVNHFDTLHTPVPFVSPVSRRFLTSDNPDGYTNENIPLEKLSPIKSYEESQQARMDKMEERVQLMEALLKAYYIDEEIFYQLDHAINQGDQASIDGDTVLDSPLQKPKGIRNRLLKKTYV
ncbi:hypothetical protein CLU79DRAFT_744091 [Phycomyces nitens]|nr:hypothetical protein CLU79DRAFT_744091 [Phycomyces nitens]